MIPVPQKKGRGRPRKYLRLEDVLEWRQQKKDKDSKTEEEEKQNSENKNNYKNQKESKAENDKEGTILSKYPDSQKHLHPVIDTDKYSNSIKIQIFEKSEFDGEMTNENVDSKTLKLNEEMNEKEGDESLTFYVHCQGFIILTFTFLRRNFRQFYYPVLLKNIILGNVHFIFKTRLSKRKNIISS